MANENDMKTSTAVGLSGTESPVKSPVEVPVLSPALRQRLSELTEDTDAVLAEAQKKRDEMNGAINWADLRCVDAGLNMTLFGTGLYVLIEEADPSQAKLGEFVAHGLRDRGWEYVEVRFEW